jgi:hypothetical protein
MSLFASNSHLYSAPPKMGRSLRSLSFPLHGHSYKSQSRIPLVTRLSVASTKHFSAGHYCRTETSLFYLKPLELYQAVKPYHLNVPAWSLPPGMQSNEVSEPVHNIQITNVRGREREFTLDKNGFQYFKDTDANGTERTVSLSTCLEYEDYASRSMIRERYWPEVKYFLKGILCAEEVIPFTHEVSSANLPVHCLWL